MMTTIRVNGIDIYYEIHGQGDPLVLIEGLASDHNAWVPHLDELTKHFQCLIFDNRGMGFTDKPDGEYTSRMYADDTAKLMEAVGFDKAHLAGLSMGACIVQELCLSYPQNVLSMVLVSGWARPDKYFTELVNLWIQMAEKDEIKDLWTDVLLWSFSPKMYDERPEDIDKLKEDLERADISLKAFVQQSRSLLTHDAYDRLSGVKAPALILVGSLDIFTPYRLAEELHRAIPGSKLEVLQDQAHAFPLENPQMFDQALIRFIQNSRNT